ncbi:MAG TPA: VWA domain-containing protein [archaeon]|nr:VWA domain-containing protein [archaeon]
MNFEFANKYLLLLLLVLAPLAWIYFRWIWRRKRALRFSDVPTVLRVTRSWTRYLPHVPFALRLGILVLMILAIARPRSGATHEDISSEGIDIILTVDISTSMLAEDLRRGENRLEVAKGVVDDFIGRRKHDRIGLVAFAAKSVTRCPPTLDYRVLSNQLESLEIGMIEDGTAIGVALASSVNRLRSSKAKSRIIILLTDGMNNRGEIDPLTAAKVAEAKDVKVYTIGVGSRGMAPVPVKDAFGRTRYVNQPVEIDEATLKEIAATTGGVYYRATKADELEKIYHEIDSLEKTKIEVRQYQSYTELFAFFLLPALVLLVAEVILSGTKFKTIP